MIKQIAFGCIMMIVTTFVHSGFNLAALGILRAPDLRRWGLRTRWTRVSLVAATVLMMFLASLIEVMIWAATYLWLGALDGVEKALYFSMVTFTTLGYGEIVLGEQWRLLASFEAANGIMMFGWTTALIFAVVHRIALREHVVEKE